jgi:SSS family solute:Na+ symporter
MSDELVLLARVSFTGTSMIAPVVLGAVIFKHPPKSLLILSSFALGYFILSLLGIVPDKIAGQSLDFVMYGILALITSVLMIRHHFTQKTLV